MSSAEKIVLKPIGFVKTCAEGEEVKDKSVYSKSLFVKIWLMA
jgi:hypothetical protein